MLQPSPLTSTPFSVKDILNMELQQEQQESHINLQRHRSSLLGLHPQCTPQHFQAAASSCMLQVGAARRGADSPDPFSEDGEADSLAYLSALAVEAEPGTEASPRIPRTAQCLGLLEAREGPPRCKSSSPIRT